METISSGSSAVRSTFLTILCVLTFIGSGWGVIGAVRSYVGANTISSMANGAMQNAEDKIDEGGGAPTFVKQLFSSVAVGLTPDNIRKSAILRLISCLLTLVGAILMWNLNRTGFYLYIAGIAFLVLAPIMVMGTGIAGLVAAGSSGFLGVIFIALYAVNLKDMKK